MDIKPVGVCRRNTPPFVGVQMRFWQPVLLVETVKQSGQCGINEFAPVMSMLTPAAQDKNMFFASPSQSDTTTLQGNEAHVFGFPFSDAVSTALEAPCEGPPDFGGVVSYLSELDADEWRQARMEKSNPAAMMTFQAGAVCDKYGVLLPGMCVGHWGALYPRVGYSMRVSEVVASALSVFRAVDIAALKPQTPHHVVAPVLFWPSVRFDKMQMVSPVSGRCMAVGADPQRWDWNVRSKDGRYVWIYWRKKECCLF
ncbi:MAG: TraU family protein [Candidatus Omnitrophica bacterium]|nr:TraU family protein [Candidatus Omnitrophota bacterium]